jgi:hypothetical protein
MSKFTGTVDRVKDRDFDLSLDDILEGDGGVYEVNGHPDTYIVVFPDSEYITALYVCDGELEVLDYESWETDSFRLTDLNVEVKLT